VGGATVLAAAALTLMQRDSKRLLAYSTLVALGTLVLLIGVGTPAAIKAMVVFLFAHALYKAPLFMTAGSVDHEAGTRDVTRLAGLGRSMPWTWLAAGVAGVSAAGLPPMLGFVGKELAYEGLYGAPWLLAALIAAGAVLVLVVVLVAWVPFAGLASGRRRRRTRRRRRCSSGRWCWRHWVCCSAWRPGWCRTASCGRPRPPSSARRTRSTSTCGTVSRWRSACRCSPCRSASCSSPAGDAGSPPCSSASAACASGRWPSTRAVGGACCASPSCRPASSSPTTCATT
jgi:hypothetical protein